MVRLRRLTEGASDKITNMRRHTMANQGGTHEQHVKAGQKSHKNSDSGSKSASASSGNGDNGKTRGGSHEQHVKAGQQSHKNS